MTPSPCRRISSPIWRGEPSNLRSHAVMTRRSQEGEPVGSISWLPGSFWAIRGLVSRELWSMRTDLGYDIWGRKPLMNTGQGNRRVRP